MNWFNKIDYRGESLDLETGMGGFGEGLSELWGFWSWEIWESMFLFCGKERKTGETEARARGRVRGRSGRVGSSGMGRVVGFQVKKSYLGGRVATSVPRCHTPLRTLLHFRFRRATPLARCVSPRWTVVRIFESWRDVQTPLHHPAPNSIINYFLTRVYQTSLRLPALNRQQIL